MLFKNERISFCFLLQQFIIHLRWSHTSLQQLAVEEEFPSVNLRESSTHEFFTSTPWPQTLLAYYPDLPNILRDSTNLSVFSTKNYAGIIVYVTQTL